jgi:hypothetical protein
LKKTYKLNWTPTSKTLASTPTRDA